MTSYSDEDVVRGAEAFEQDARIHFDKNTQEKRISAGFAIGILSAAMRSGLPATHIEQMIDRQDPGNAALLRRVLTRYEGDDWAMDLWHLQSNGRYKLCTALCRPGFARWKYASIDIDAA